MASVIKLETGQIGVAESAGIAYVPIVRTGDLSGAVRIEYGVTADTATAGVDFTTSAGSQFLTMEAGQSRALALIWSRAAFRSPARMASPAATRWLQPSRWSADVRNDDAASTRLSSSRAAAVRPASSSRTAAK